MNIFTSSPQRDTAVVTIFFSPNRVKLSLTIKLVLKIWIFLENLRHVDTIVLHLKYLFKLCIIVMIPYDLLLKVSLADVHQYGKVLIGQGSILIV